MTRVFRWHAAYYIPIPIFISRKLFVEIIENEIHTTYRLRFFEKGRSNSNNRKELELNQCTTLSRKHPKASTHIHTHKRFLEQNFVKSSIKSTLQDSDMPFPLLFGISIFRFYIFYPAVVILLAAKVVAACFFGKVVYVCVCVAPIVFASFNKLLIFYAYLVKIKSKENKKISMLRVHCAHIPPLCVFVWKRVFTFYSGYLNFK